MREIIFLKVRPLFEQIALADHFTPPRIYLPLMALSLLFPLSAETKTAERASDRVALGCSSKGISSLVYRNRDYLEYGRLTVSRVVFAGTPGNGSTKVDSENFDAGCLASAGYPWGSVQLKANAESNRVLLTIKVTNRSNQAITDLSLEPLRVRLSSKPSEYDGSIPLLATNIGGPTVVSMSTPDANIVLSNEELVHPLLIGFPWALDRPKSTEFPIRVVTGSDPMYPDSVPRIQRAIPPRGSDSYKLSLRFGGPDAKPFKLAEDLYARLASEYPNRLHWSDRRPIGALILGTASTGWPANPRGWFLDPSLNVQGGAGIRDFNKRLMAWADNSIRILRQMNAQGMITWDLEGERYPHPATYVGDPRLVESLAPEMAASVDSYFKRFRDAGLRVGLTIRPQQFVVSADKSRATQEPATDPVQLLNDKIHFAHERWGATLFYVDSNGDSAFPLDSSVLRRVAQMNPDVLLIPEHCSLDYYGFSAPYRELRSVQAPSSLPRLVYPTAFSVINTADGNVGGREPELSRAVSEGDVLMFRGWFDDPANLIIQQIYRQKASLVR